MKLADDSSRLGKRLVVISVRLSVDRGFIDGCPKLCSTAVQGARSVGFSRAPLGQFTTYSNRAIVQGPILRFKKYPSSESAMTAKQE